MNKLFVLVGFSLVISSCGSGHNHERKCVPSVKIKGDISMFNIHFSGANDFQITPPFSCDLKSDSNFITGFKYI
ncbi:MAG: hypothetical protein JXR95_03455, partial [Deltaproteobacteria bacterium]|nr:hypothetical protein [Deltaproteobacteria bacterium]